MAPLERPQRRRALGALPLPSELPAAELALHALAQAPESVRLELDHSAYDAHLVRLAEAYRVSNRLRFASGTGDRVPHFDTPDSTIDLPTLQALTMGAVVERISEGSPPSVQLDDGSNDAMLSGQRVVIVTNYPAHYRIPLFQGMARRLKAAGAELHVMFLSPAAEGRPWLADLSTLEFDHEFLASVRLPIRQRAPHVPMGLERRLRSRRPSMVLAAGFSPFVALRAARTAREIGAIFGVWSGETAAMHTAHQRGRYLARLHIANRSDFAIAYGARAASYLRGLRTNLPMVIGRNTAPVPDRLHEPKSGSARDMYEIVLIGDLASPRKGVDVVLEALRLRPDLPLRLSVVGGGRLLGQLADHASRDDRIRLLGPLPPQEVLPHLELAAAFVFPTRSDVFGLALVEAMGHALAPIVSPAAGAVDDLAVDGHNSIIVEGHRATDWAAALALISDDPVRVTELGASARRTIEARWTVQHAVDAMVAGLRLGSMTLVPGRGK